MYSIFCPPQALSSTVFYPYKMLNNVLSTEHYINREQFCISGFDEGLYPVLVIYLSVCTRK